jgi:hypothetical protein
MTQNFTLLKLNKEQENHLNSLEQFTIQLQKLTKTFDDPESLTQARLSVGGMADLKGSSKAFVIKKAAPAEPPGPPVISFDSKKRGS